MKKILSIFLASMMLLTTSCGEMDQYPHNGVSTENLTPEDAQLLLTGLYVVMQNKPTANGYMCGDLLGGDIIRGGATGITNPVIMIQDLVTPEGGIVSGQWNGYMTALHQVNSFIVSLDRLPEGSARNEMLGVASYFRALIYFNLVSRYAEVPLLSAPNKDDVAASTEAEGWAFIERDLTVAMELCPTFTSKNYVSRQAAKALMARTKLHMGRGAEAARLADELIAEGTFGLSDFSAIFRGQDNREEIFTFANLLMESDVNLGAQYYSRAHANGGSYTYAPTATVMKMFDPYDNRAEMSIDVQGTNNVINKFGGGEANPDPLIISRMGEIYLISAEGRGLAGGGLDRLNALRAARGLQPVTATTEEAFLTLVLDERRHELLGEGFRWFDLSRTDRLKSTLGLDDKYKRLPIPAREMQLNRLLKQNSYWTAQ